MTEALAAAVKQARENPELKRLIDPTIPPRSEPFVRLNQSLSGFPAFGGNSVELLADYGGSIHCMAEEVDRAQRYVHLVL